MKTKPSTVLLAGVLLALADALLCRAEDAGLCSAPAWSPDGKRIAFSVRTTGPDDPSTKDHLFLVNPDGTGLLRVAGPPEKTMAPVFRWLPGNEGIAFGAGGDVWAVRSDGTELRMVAQSVSIDEADWSPDGTQIAFVKEPEPENPETWILTIAQNAKRRLTDGSCPKWSPDGKKIAFVTGKPAVNLPPLPPGVTPMTPLERKHSLSVIDEDGRNHVDLTTGKIEGTKYANQLSNFHWLPDSRSILLLAKERIWAVNADGSGLAAVAPETLFGLVNVSLSPRGNEIACEKGGDIWRIGLSRVPVSRIPAYRQLTKTPRYREGEPSWSPDGRKIVCIRGPCNGLEVVVFNSDGSNETVVYPSRRSAARSEPPGPQTDRRPARTERSSVSTISQSVLRTWTDRTGKYRTEASLVKFKDGKVTLKKKDGAIVEVPLESLSDIDQQYVEQRATRPR